jgi:chromosomal replication initiator protein
MNLATEARNARTSFATPHDLDRRQPNRDHHPQDHHPQDHHRTGPRDRSDSSRHAPSDRQGDDHRNGNGQTCGHSDVAGELTVGGRPRRKTSIRSQRAPRHRADAIAAELQRRIGSHKYEMWFGQATLEIRDTTLEIRADNPFVAQRIDANFAATLRGVAHQALGENASVTIRVDPTAPRDADPDAARDPGKSAHAARGMFRNGGAAMPGDRRESLPRSGRSTRLHALEDFVTGPTNQLAHTMCVRLADEADAEGLSPLFIHGECGVGKTHLLQGVCRRYIERTGRTPQVRYVTAEQFTNEFIAAIKTGTTDAFRKRLRRLDLLAIDDVHFLADKGKTQSEFQHTIDAIAHSGARVVLASDHHPQHIQRFSQALVSRFMSGMVVKIERPDRALRRKLIERMAQRRGLRLNDAAIDELAGRCAGSVRELEGAITRVTAYRDLLGGAANGNGVVEAEAGTADQEVGLLLVEQVLREERARPARIVHIASIIDAVCNRLGVTKADLISASRHRKIVLGRSLAVYLSRELTAHSYPEIAQALGRVNHSTVHTADQRLRRQLDADQPLEPGMAEPARSLRELADMLRRDVCRAGE